MRKTDINYWENIWKQKNIDMLDENEPLNKFIINYLKKIPAENKKIIEAGCANSRWVKFLTENGFEVSGIDYSEEGIKNLKIYCDKNRIKCNLYLKDIFDDIPFLKEKFDVLISFGLVEHFEDYSEVIQKLSCFLKKDGIIITVIPNLKNSIYYKIQKLSEKNILKKHVMINLKDLENAHSSCFEKINCAYAGKINFFITNFGSKKNLSIKIIRFIFYILNKIFSKIITRESSFYSQSIVYIGRKK
ncbi:MAG: class I SAM-dependent methyltransferase [Candidatus Muiribacteriota bacterium]